MTMVDAQAGIGLILKPPKNFETVYEGEDATIPIPFVARNLAGEFTFLDDVAGADGVASDLTRFVPVPLGASMLLCIPRALFADGAALRAPSYVYDLRWRLRTASDAALREMVGDPTHPFQLVPQFGAPSTPAPTARLVLPAYTSETVTPATVGSDSRTLIAPGVYGTVGQGVYDPAAFSGLGDPDAGNLALGPVFFPPLLRAVLGNELSVVARKASGTWAFTDTGATGDAAFSNIYGTNVGGDPHPYYDGVGIVLITMSRSTTP